jgi:eukaryotic-like serine/threonine-protein kinase
VSGGYIAGRYRVVRELGRGGMGVVYVVEHIHTGEYLALKLLHGAAAVDPAVISRFKREARVGAQIRSEYVVRVTDADTAPELGGAPFFVMELLEGLDLETLVKKVGALHADAVAQLLGQVARALEKAHRIGIVHRDLKPENIFLQRRDDDVAIAKILDFGISKFLHSNDGRQGALGVTQAGAMMGTPFYMSPEQARGDVDAIDATTDLWALGIVAIRLLTGENYWTATKHADLTVQLLAAPMPKPSVRWPWLGARVDDWFARSCHRDRSLRWTSASEQIGALAEALRGAESRGATMPSIVEVLRKTPSDRPSKLAETAGSGIHDEPAIPAERTLTANMPPVAPRDFESTKAVGGTTAGGSLTRTAPDFHMSQARRILMAAVALGIVASLWILYRIFSPAPAMQSHGKATVTPSADPTYLLPAETPSDAPAIKAGQDGVEKSQAVDNPAPIERASPKPTASALPSSRPPPITSPPKHRSRNPRPADSVPGQPDDPMRP